MKPVLAMAINAIEATAVNKAGDCWRGANARLRFQHRCFLIFAAVKNQDIAVTRIPIKAYVKERLDFPMLAAKKLEGTIPLETTVLVFGMFVSCVIGEGISFGLSSFVSLASVILGSSLL